MLKKHSLLSASYKKVGLISLMAGLFIIIILTVVPLLSHAQVGELERTACTAGICGQTDLAIMVGRIVRIILSLLGLIAVIIIIIGGFQWMTSGGSEEKITKAKSLMANGVIGLLIIVLAYAIAMFVISKIQFVVKPTTPVP